MKKYIQKAMTFDGYKKMLDDLLAEGKTTGLNQSAAMFGYGRLNRQRMARLEKSITINTSLDPNLKNVTKPMIWLIVTEGWCGDAAQNIPVIEKIAEESDKIKTLYVLRDENPDLIDQYLTDGARSIPKLIALDNETLEVLGSWGARPAPAQKLYLDLIAKGFEKPEIQEEVQRWYNNDKGQSLQKEFVRLLEQWNIETNLRAAA